MCSSQYSLRRYNKKKNVQFSNIQTEYGDDENEVKYSYTGHMNAYCNPSSMRTWSNQIMEQIKAVATDGEGAFHVLKNDNRANGSEFITKPKNGHLTYADIKIKIIKELMRTVISSTKFPMPRMILKAIAFYVNEMKNYSSNSGNINILSPYIFIANGRSLDYSVVRKGKVLDYAEASDENIIQRNSVLKQNYFWNFIASS